MSALLTPDLYLLRLIIPIILIIFFYKGRGRITLLIVFIIFYIITNYTAVIMEEGGKSKEGLYRYRTVTGWIESCKIYKTGSGVVGIFTADKEKFYTVYNVKSELVVLKIPFATAIISMREGLSSYLHYASKSKISLTNALIFGDTKYIPNDVKDKFTITGLTHILSVSGMHVAIIASIIFALLFRLQRKLKLIAAILLLSLFAPAAGFKIPVLRSVLFAWVIMGAYLVDIRVNFIKFTTVLAAFFILVDHNIIHDPSFVLSFLSVYGIFYFIEEGADNFFQPIIVGLAATAFTLPYVMYNFGSFNYMAFINTVMLSPFITVLIFLGLPAILIPQLMTSPLIIMEKITLYALDVIYSLSEWSFILYKIPLYLYVTALAILIAAVIMKKRYAIFVIFIIPLHILTTKPNYAGVIIPYMPHSRCVISLGSEREIYFSGSYYEYKYRLIPFLLKLNAVRFHKGTINIFNGSNLFINIEKESYEMENVCMNNVSDRCKIIVPNKKDNIDLSDKNKIFVMRNSDISRENVYNLQEGKVLQIIDGQVNLLDEDKM